MGGRRKSESGPEGGERDTAPFRVRLVPESDGAFVVVRQGDYRRVGRVEYRPRCPGPDWLTITGIDISREERGWEYGSEAVRCLEKLAMEQRLAGRFAAAVEPDDGLGLYFWLRLGYRPAAAGEAPRDGKFWLVRDCQVARREHEAGIRTHR